ncbi:MAG TPA: hypothetical protein VJ731_09595 [Terriglobales bacterium]|nr:hypothetical protein [Terriglobales bacterium]
MKRKGEKVPNPKRVLSRVQRIPPTSEAARDEGPRLLPLGERSKDPSRLEHYLDLADTALGLKRDTNTP